MKILYRKNEKYLISDSKTGDVAKSICLSGIRIYQRYLSPLKSTKCPYIPTCSAYGAEAVEKYGAVRGSALALYRIIRCNPLSKGGYDPVP
ncbi:MAG: membrane protein insertion efficiency factor YidD [Lachnospiraceae bacterium]|nr:membrane protein insertion efficiency factor YidD [Lachnospiraceae bacterium]